VKTGISVARLPEPAILDIFSQLINLSVTVYWHFVTCHLPKQAWV